jgi:hypothetical protein
MDYRGRSGRTAPEIWCAQRRASWDVSATRESDKLLLLPEARNQLPVTNRSYQVQEQSNGIHGPNEISQITADELVPVAAKTSATSRWAISMNA